MRTGLTQRGWNNVLIFASLFMIILFNTTHQKLFDGDPYTEIKSLLPQQSVVQVIDYSGFKIERIGTGFRLQTFSAAQQNIDGQKFVNNWQSVSLSVLAEPPEFNNSVISLPVLVQAIGLDSQQIFMVYMDKDTELAHIHNKVSDVWFVLTLNELYRLVPVELLQRED